MVENNPWDRTIWDPIESEHAIEDLLHGPTAVHNSLQIPAMPHGDGTYYQPGAFYVHGTAHVDSQDRPVLRIGLAHTAGMREVARLQEWVKAYHEGEEALTALESERQQERLKKTGFARCYKPSDVCPGGKKLEKCETGNTAYQDGQKWAATNHQEKAGEGIRSNVLAWAGGKCVACPVSCQVAVQTWNGQPQETRVSFYKPPTHVPVITLDLTPKPSPVTDAHMNGDDPIQLARHFYRGIVDKDPGKAAPNNNETDFLP